MITNTIESLELKKLKAHNIRTKISRMIKEGHKVEDGLDLKKTVRITAELHSVDCVKRKPLLNCSIKLGKKLQDVQEVTHVSSNWDIVLAIMRIWQ